MTVISMDKLLFWLTQVSLFTLGAWERTLGQWSLNWGSPFSNFVTAKKVKFVPAQWLRKVLISICRALPEYFCSRCVSVWWFLLDAAYVNLSIMTSKARTLRESTLSYQRRAFWKRKTQTLGWRTSWEQ